MNKVGPTSITQHKLAMLVVVLVCGLFSPAQAQLTSDLTPAQHPATGMKITGKIVDGDTKLPLGYCNISAYSAKDSLYLAGTVSGADGSFSLGTNHSAFFLQITYLAYLPVVMESPRQNNAETEWNVGVVELTPNVELMLAVEVRAEKSTVMMTLDKRVFNVGKDLTSVGGTAEDVLRNVPGISLNNDGQFSLRGNANIRILLNGRASSLVNNENLTGLRQIRASQIEQVEIITNPSARYEAEGMAGIINIVLKSNEQKGLNGSFDALFGNNENKGIGANLNFCKRKFNGFFGVGGWFVNRPGTGSFRNRFYNPEHLDSTVFSNMDRRHARASSPGFVKFGTDYHPNAKNTITTSFDLRSSSGKNTSDLTYTDALGVPANVYLITQRVEKEKERERDWLYALIYKKSFSRKGHQLVSEVQVEDRLANRSSVFDERYFDGAKRPLTGIDYLQRSANEEGTRRLGINVDYILPLKKGGKFEAGWQRSFRKIFNNYAVKEIINNIENPDTDLTNDFLYRETIHGLYVNYGVPIKKFALQTGLRAEHTEVGTELLSTKQSKVRRYPGFFPSVFLTYNLADNNAFQWSYSRRIQRPVTSDLNPFFTIRDRRNIFRGNPNIQPEYTDSYELGYVRYWAKTSLSAVAYFRKTKNVVKRIQRLEKDFPGVTITQAENLELKRNQGVEFTFALFPVPWWRLNGDVNIFHSLSEGTYFNEGKEVFVGGGSFTMLAKTHSQVTLWEKIHTQSSVFYSAPRRTTQGVNKATTVLDFAVGMDFFKKNGTLTLGVNDIFNSRRRRSFSQDDTFYSEDNFLWQARTVLLSFHYRFNQQKEPNRIYANPFLIEDEQTP